jgi:hypothetical protein
MFVTVVVIMCSMAGLCQEEIVTDSNMTEGLTVMSCMTGAQAPLAKWKAEHPVYRNDDYRIVSYKCVQGHYEPKGRA